MKYRSRTYLGSVVTLAAASLLQHAACSSTSKHSGVTEGGAGEAGMHTDSGGTSSSSDGASVGAGGGVGGASSGVGGVGGASSGGVGGVGGASGASSGGVGGVGGASGGVGGVGGASGASSGGVGGASGGVGGVGGASGGVGGVGGASGGVGGVGGASSGGVGGASGASSGGVGGASGASGGVGSVGGASSGVGSVGGASSGVGSVGGASSSVGGASSSVGGASSSVGGASSSVGGASTGGPPEPCDGACGGATPVCDEATDTCVGCLASAEHCEAPTPVCDLENHECVDCAATSDCDSSVCDCVCVNDSDCDDGLPCTQDACNANTCSHTLESDSCLIAGTCRDDNSPHPTNACRYCDASANQTGWSNAGAGTSCDDGVWCNGADTCNAGTCSHEFSGGSRCASGSTCNNTCNEAQQNCFSPTTQACGNPTEYRCEGGCGGDAESRLGTQYCTGFSGECAGTIDFGDWDIEDDCDGTEVCTGNSSSAACAPNHQCACEASTETYYDDDSELCWELDHSDLLYAPAAGETYCAGRDTGDITDWELPNIADLITLLRGCRNGFEEGIDELSQCQLEVDGISDPTCWEDESCNGVESCASCDEGAGPANGCYWPAELEGTCSHHYSSTARTSQSHWRVSFQWGTTGEGHDETNSYFVRCVRRP